MEFHIPRALMAENETQNKAEPPLHQALATKSSAGILLRPTVAIILVALTTTLSLTCLLFRLYAKNCRRRGAATSSNSMPAYGTAAEQRTSGVNRMVIESLPFFRFASLQGEKEGAECAVCLGRFEAAELLRLLPKCRHAFHIECVDAWLESHPACPLCRTRVNPEDVFILAGGADAHQPPTPPERRLSDRKSSSGEGSSGAAALPITGERRRKDGLLLPGNHRVIFAGGEGMRERWSDLHPADLMFLQLEGRGGACGVDHSRIRSRRSESAVTFDQQPEEERTMQKWLGFAAMRTARWPGAGQYSGG